MKSSKFINGLMVRARDQIASAGERSTQQRMLELPFFAVLPAVIGALLFSNYSLGIASGFLWVAALPIVYAARYGSGWGALCALVAGVVWVQPFLALEGSILQRTVMAIGTLCLAIVVGASSDRWRIRSNQSEAENAYLRHRLKEFSNDYHVLKVSHGHLEEFMAGQRLSLRSALQALTPVFTSSDEGIQAGSELMAVFAQFCSVQVAGLYSMKSDTVVNPEAIATHGDMGDLPIFDPLIRDALKERKLVSLRLDSVSIDTTGESLLAVVPIADSSGRLHGVLAVRDMHFMAFQQENLNVLALLGGYFGDLLSRSEGRGKSRTAWFLSEIDSSLRFCKSHSVPSTLVCARMANTEQARAVAHWLSTDLRSLDRSWILPSKTDGPTVSILLPLQTKNQSADYLRRVATDLLKKHDVALPSVVVEIDAMQLSKSDTRASCLTFINKVSGLVASEADKSAHEDSNRVA